MKPDNMLMHVANGMLVGKVGDVGLCTLSTPEPSTVPATESYSAPEAKQKVAIKQVRAACMLELHRECLLLH
jgi:hypothetical protein